MKILHHALKVLDYGMKAANHYEETRNNLGKIGKPIDPNDLHIASHARSEAMVLVSNNLEEFNRVDGLRLENWI